MQTTRFVRLPIFGSVLTAGALFVASIAGNVSAASMADFRAGLEGAGYAVRTGETVKYPALKLEARVIVADKGGAQARVEIIEYGSQARMSEDWQLVSGQSPTPRVATNDFARRSVYWNEDSILLVDFRAPNDAGTAQVVGNVFLGQRGTGGPVVTSAARTDAATVSTPRTGDANLLHQQDPRRPVWLPLVIGAFALAGAGAGYSLGLNRNTAR